jgi:hypothetical protein
VNETTTLEPLSLGDVMRLNARTWLEPVPDERPLPVLMLTYPAPQFDDVDPDVVESTMRRVAGALGAVPAGPEVPDGGVRISTHGLEALLWFTGCSYALKISHPRWLRELNSAGRALLAVGLDELSPVAAVAEVDEYRQHARQTGRMHFAFARVGRRALGGAA